MSEHLSTDTMLPQLVINSMSRQTYMDLSAEGKIYDDQLYFVDDDQFDAGSERILNVADPTEATDAANKGYVDSKTSAVSKVYVNGTKSDLSVVKTTAAAYENLVKTNGTLSNALYVVEDTTANMYGERVTNVGTPTADTDAATKAYVDSQLDEVANMIMNATYGN